MMKKLHTLSLAAATVLLASCGGDSDDNLPPAARDANYRVEADTTLMEQLKGFDGNGDELTYSLASEVDVGELSVSPDGSFNYTPPMEYTGTAMFSYSVSDGEFSDTGDVMITVEAKTVSTAAYVRDAFNQDERAQPLSVNGREFTDDVVDTAEFADLVSEGQQ
ncbi:MAG: hypothetical protein CMF13_04220 [Idiomarina sp.]|jgi:hypothetical protein|uniref:Ig-like domain-containing protein n=1 Tax=Idiomarina TaxID=135575 RepID=UPI00079B47E2|nr:Ig-like domain-containing protein [Idiomarina sp. T82-3]KXS34551.1 MAG: hypothetical protein AWU56_1856 [Idiomarina sp. T82-3]MBR37547.1 hypothetical protein [Idiomarina sp.]